jgi:hypothetical protein
MPSYSREHFEMLASAYGSAYARLRTSLHIAFIYGRGGMLLGMAMNRVGTRSSGAGFSDMTIHAERAALKAVGDVTLLDGATLVVIRVGKGGTLMSSAPCPECRCCLQAAMRKYGLRRVLYS